MPDSRSENCETILRPYMRSVAENLLRLSQECMDLTVAERLRLLAAEIKRRAS